MLHRTKMQHLILHRTNLPHFCYKHLRVKMVSVERRPSVRDAADGTDTPSHRCLAQATGHSADFYSERLCSGTGCS